jgi:hypothetical protein
VCLTARGVKSKEIRKKRRTKRKTCLLFYATFFSINIDANERIDASRFYCKAFDFNQNYNTPAKLNKTPNFFANPFRVPRSLQMGRYWRGEGTSGHIF